MSTIGAGLGALHAAQAQQQATISALKKANDTHAQTAAALLESVTDAIPPAGKTNGHHNLNIVA